MGFILFIITLGAVYGIAAALGASFIVATVLAWFVALAGSFVWFRVKNPHI